jgi:alkanesulfonate monooxygenase SsuD/methylene tetrahydromethanopterin reductase-like flavin-dependent oxidoreductase (luciferase family)
MGIVLHWFLSTNGDSRTDLSLGNAVGAAGSRAAEDGNERAPDIRYIGQIARSAEQLGFTGALTPTSSWCKDAWIMTAGLTQITKRFKFLVAFRPGLMSPTLAAHMAATYQRISGARLLLNVVTGGDDVEQQRFGDHLGKEARYERAGEFLHIVRELWHGDPVTFKGQHYDVRAEPVGRRGPGLRWRGHRAGRQPRRGGGPDRRVLRARHRRVHPVRLPAPGRGLPGRRGPDAGPAAPRPDDLPDDDN